MAESQCSDLSKAEEILGRYPQEEPALIQVLQDVHRAYNYLPCDVLERVADALDVPLAKVFSVSTFYRAFSLEPQGDTIVKVCMGTACHIRGAGQLAEELERQLGVVKTVNCVGACAMAPLVIVGEKYFGSAKPARVSKYLAEGGADEN
jgi:NADH-quinone oxidoreductase subunit E